MSDLPTLVEQSQTFQYITFKVGDEFFGVDIHGVSEIILKSRITSIPRTPDYFLGISNLRGEIISVIDLRIRFSLPPHEYTPDSRIIVILSRGIKIGMLVDKVVSITHMDSTKVRKSPPFVSKEQQQYISASYQMDDNSLLLLLDHQEIINLEDFRSFIEIEKASHTNDHEDDRLLNEEKKTVKEIHMVGFSIGMEYYGVEGASVEEIIELPEVTLLPEMESFVEGIFHLRENVIPLVKLAERLQLKSTVPDKDCHVIIAIIEGIRVGLIVDMITEVFHIREDEIVAPPSNLNKVQLEQLKGIIKLTRSEKTRVVMVMNNENFFTQREKALLRDLGEKLEEGSEEESNKQAEEEISIIEFLLGDKKFAILVMDSNEIIPVREIVPVPKSPPFIRGVINLRGVVITVVDLPKLVYDEKHEFNEKTKLLIVQPEEEIAALIVDDLIGIRRVKLSSFEPPSDLVKEKENIFIQGIGKEEDLGAIMILIDIRKTLAEAERYTVPQGEDTEPELLTATTS